MNSGTVINDDILNESPEEQVTVKMSGMQF